MSYQININAAKYGEKVNMQAVEAACAQWMADEQENRRGERGNFIYVEFGYVGVAVDAINALGYTTDEDEESIDRDHMADEVGI